MGRSSPNHAAESSQIDRFKKAARELGADRDGASDKLMGRMAKMKPEPRSKSPPRKNDKSKDDKPGH